MPTNNDTQIATLLEGIRLRLSSENRESPTDLHNDGPSTTPAMIVAPLDPIRLFTDALERFQSTFKSGLEELRDEIYGFKAALHEACDERIQDIKKTEESMNVESESVSAIGKCSNPVSEPMEVVNSFLHNAVVLQEDFPKEPEEIDGMIPQSQVPFSFWEFRRGDNLLEINGIEFLVADQSLGIENVKNHLLMDLQNRSHNCIWRAQQNEHLCGLEAWKVAGNFKNLPKITTTLCAQQLFDQMLLRGKENQQRILRKILKSRKFKYKLKLRKLLLHSSWSIIVWEGREDLFFSVFMGRMDLIELALKTKIKSESPKCNLDSLILDSQKVSENGFTHPPVIGRTNCVKDCGGFSCAQPNDSGQPIVLSLIPSAPVSLRLSLAQLRGDNPLSVEDFCESCNARVDITCCIKLPTLSPVITFQLKRCVLLPKTMAKKNIKSSWSFSHVLDMELRLAESYENELLHVLFDVLIHKGSMVHLPLHRSSHLHLAHGFLLVPHELVMNLRHCSLFNTLAHSCCGILHGELLGVLCLNFYQYISDKFGILWHLIFFRSDMPQVGMDFTKDFWILAVRTTMNVQHIQGSPVCATSGEAGHVQRSDDEVNSRVPCKFDSNYCCSYRVVAWSSTWNFANSDWEQPRDKKQRTCYKTRIFKCQAKIRKMQSLMYISRAYEELFQASNLVVKVLETRGICYREINGYNGATCRAVMK